MKWRKRKLFSTGRFISSDFPVLTANDDPYRSAWLRIEKRLKKEAVRGVPVGGRHSIEIEFDDHLSGLYELFEKAVNSIESRPDMRLPLLRLLSIGDGSENSIEFLANELGDMLAHSRCFWMRPLTDRESGVLTGTPAPAYSGRLFSLAMGLNKTRPE